MRKSLFLSLLLLCSGIILRAQTPQQLKKVIELKMPKTIDDEMAGTRGAGVAWHPVQKKYYASFAGNMGYPMGVFDATGKRISNDELTTQADTRGLWYNPVSKLVCGNAYDEGGWFNYVLDQKGIPTDINIVSEGMNQPDQQSQGAFNTLTKQVLFLHNSWVYTYNKDAAPVDSIAIHWGRKKADGAAEDEDLEVAPEDYNYTSVVYTGIKGQELGFLNITEKQVELYDIKTGFLTKTLTFPDTATVESAFNFSYTNNMYWLFDIESRQWLGYK